MAVFAVLGSDEPEKLDSKIKSVFEDSLHLGTGQWLISEPKLTTKEVSLKIGDDGSMGTFVVVPVNNYWGRHYSATWEWLQKKAS